MPDNFDVVDLGTKHGNAIEAFLTRAGATVLDPETVAKFKPERCVGYEREHCRDYAKIVQAKGFQFRLTNLAHDAGLERLPVSQVYLAWHLLEHLPDKIWGQKVVIAALSRTARLAWFRLSSFQPDSKNGEGVLREMGLRFTWTTWTEHASAWLVEDCLKAINLWKTQQPGREFECIVKPADYIRSVRDVRVVPINSPIDATAYNFRFGPKPRDHKLKTPIVAAWEVIVKFKT
jgi:hypothetical protein